MITTDLSGRVALDTGSAQGLGEATAQALADAGATVAVVDLQDERGAQVAAALGASDREVFINGAGLPVDGGMGM